MTDQTNTTAPVEGKVWAATAGAGAGGTVAILILWLLGVLVWHEPATAANSAEAIAAVPFPVNGGVLLVVAVGGTFAGGWLAKHTPRPDEVAAAAQRIVAGALEESAGSPAVVEAPAIVVPPSDGAGTVDADPDDVDQVDEDDDTDELEDGGELPAGLDMPAGFDDGSDPNKVAP